MIQPEELRTITENALSGLTADESLKQRILQKASETSTQKTREPVYRPVLKLCAIVGVLLLMVIGLNSIRPLSPSVPGELTVFAAGGKDLSVSSPFILIDIESVSGIRFSGGELVSGNKCTDLLRILQTESKLSDDEVPAGSEHISICMKDGTEKNFGISNPYLYVEDKCWTCPSFFNALK